MAYPSLSYSLPGANPIIVSVHIAARPQGLIVVLRRAYDSSVSFASAVSNQAVAKASVVAHFSAPRPRVRIGLGLSSGDDA